MRSSRQHRPTATGPLDAAVRANTAVTASDGTRGALAGFAQAAHARAPVVPLRVISTDVPLMGTTCGLLGELIHPLVSSCDSPPRGTA